MADEVVHMNLDEEPPPFRTPSARERLRMIHPTFLTPEERKELVEEIRKAYGGNG
jgi:hypothetical protein